MCVCVCVCVCACAECRLNNLAQASGRQAVIVTVEERMNQYVLIIFCPLRIIGDVWACDEMTHRHKWRGTKTSSIPKKIHNLTLSLVDVSQLDHPRHCLIGISWYKWRCTVGNFLPMNQITKDFCLIFMWIYLFSQYEKNALKFYKCSIWECLRTRTSTN